MDTEWSITVLVDPLRLADLRQAAAREPAETVESFAGESWMRCHRLRGQELFTESRYDGYAVLRDGQAVTVLLRDASAGLARYGMRVLRELFHRSEEERGSIVMHAAACSIGQAGALIVGEKGAGKTTTLLAGCLVGGADYIANDRVIVPPDEKSWRAVGFPMVCRVHPGTISRFPELTGLALRPERLVRPQHGLFHEGHQDIDVLRELAAPGTKLELTTVEMTTHLGVATTDRSTVRCLLFPRFDAARTGVRTAPLTSESARARLLSQCLTPDDDTWVAPWLLGRHRDAGRLRLAAAERLAAMAADTLAYEVIYGHRTGDIHAVGRIVADLVTS
ncbi:hypothetical protein [Streptomyces sp. TLI_053]|uniref:hypothetical protein n=1 Tax=Streptomyces sp. TLI_053 TaxID=1855352 RepID=UPI0013520D7B|nr:hypothetical protein [Streptomyces sp. TLI_053]